MTEQPQHEDDRDSGVVERDYKKSNPLDEGESISDGNSSVWFTFASLGLSVCLVMLGACGLGNFDSCWGSELWSVLGLICVAILVWETEYA